MNYQDDVTKWKHFPHYWPLVRGIHRSPVNSPHKGQWHRALMFSLICVWINGWVNYRGVGDLRRHRAYHDAIVMISIRSDIIQTKVQWCHMCISHHRHLFVHQLVQTNNKWNIKASNKWLIVRRIPRRVVVCLTKVQWCAERFKILGLHDVCHP